LGGIAQTNQLLFQLRKSLPHRDSFQYSVKLLHAPKTMPI
jgi:hypothetical protein